MSGIVGRAEELEALARLSEALVLGESQSLVIAGEAGIGKTTILQRFADLHRSWNVMECFGVESEMELPWAGLHQLCSPMMDLLPALPAPQRQALLTAFGLEPGTAPDPFLCGLAVLSLLAEAADAGPVVCVIDDAHTLDRESLRTLGFVSRRLRSDAVGMLFAVREIPQELERIPVMHVRGLRVAEAGALLDRVAPATLDPVVRERVVCESGGNPLAIVEFAGHGQVTRLAGGYRVAAAGHVAGPIEASFLRSARSLSPQSQQLMLLAACDPTGDSALVQRAALASGLDVPPEDEEALGRLVRLSPTVRFRHPLVRTAIYSASSDAERRAAHRALAVALTDDGDTDRRVWHHAQSLDGPDEAVATELERTADGARSRGGWAAAAAFLTRAAELTPASSDRARREVQAAFARFQSGDTDGALSLLVSVQTRTIDDRLLADVKLLRGQLEFYLTRSTHGAELLLEAARAIAPHDPLLARETYLEAVQAVGLAPAPDGSSEAHSVRAVARAALLEAPRVDEGRPVDLLLDALARFYADGAAAATDAARAANESLLASPTSPELVRWTVLGANLAYETFDDELLFDLAERGIATVRATGMISLFPMASWMHVGSMVVRGDFEGAETLIGEVSSVAEDAGIPAPLFTTVAVRSWRGLADGYDELVASCRDAAQATGEWHVLRFLDGITALMKNGEGDHRIALDHCKRVFADDNPTYGLVAAFEYAESANRAGTLEEVAEAEAIIRDLTSGTRTGWGRGVRALATALLASDVDPGAFFEESIAQFETTRLKPYLARTHLLHGEWLRRQGRREEGRVQLRTALEMLVEIGCGGFAARAARELGLSGGAARQHGTPAEGLTPQELQVAHMAASGMSNRQIAEQLFLSHRTVASHLYRIYPKLGITSRSQLHLVLKETSGPAVVP